MDRRHVARPTLGDQDRRQKQRLLAELDAHQRERLGRRPGGGRLGIGSAGEAQIAS